MNCIEIETIIKHPEEVNKARSCPRAYNLIASKANDSNIYLWDYSKHPTIPSSEQLNPQMVLTGHDDLGFALDWNNMKDGMLLSGSNKGDCCIWDVEKGNITENKNNTKGKFIKILNNFRCG